MLAEERHECSGCGTPLDISMDPANRGLFEVRRDTCEACVVLEAEVSNDHEGNRQPRGVKYTMVRAT